MKDSKGQTYPWRLFVSELVGTALLVLVGLSLVILMFGTGTPMARLIPSEGLRRLITGFLFGRTGASIALSPVGKVNGAHINPSVTLGFRLMGKLDWRTTLGYIVAQLIGVVVGSLPLLLWGAMGKSVAFGATWPGSGTTLSTALLGEAITTFTVVALLFVFLGFRKIRPPSHRRSFPLSTRSWCGLRRRSQAPAQTPHAALAPRSSPGNGKAGGSTGSGRWPECFWLSSPAVSLRSASKSPSYSTSKATTTACFVGWPCPGRRRKWTHERPLSHRILGPTRGDSLASHQATIGTATVMGNQAE